MKVQYSPEQARKEKYPGEKLVFLTPEEYQGKLSLLIEKFKETILQAQKESREDYDADYEIVGIVILGSWARGDVHDKSDLDLYTLVIADPANLDQDLEERLAVNGLRPDFDVQGFINVTSEDDIKRLFSNDKRLSKGENYIIVTPYPKVLEAVNQSITD
jgi:predicted nucleotidyltransferase